MLESDLGSSSFVIDAFRNICSAFDKICFSLLEIVYKLFFNVVNADILKTETIMSFYSRVQLIIGVFMVFQLTMSILKGIVNPDEFYDKGKGFSNLIKRIMISLLLLVLITPINMPNARNEYEKQINNNGILFGTLYSLQYRLISNNTLGKLILGEDADAYNYVGSDLEEDHTQIDSAANSFATTILRLFYRINVLDKKDRSDVTPAWDDPKNRVCDTDDFVNVYKDSTSTIEDITSYASETCENGPWQNFPKLVGKGSRYQVAYTEILGAIVALVFSFIFIAFSVDVAIRAIKLAILRLIAPIPIISYMNPNNKDESMNAWVKTLTTTYLDLFLRIAVIYFVLFLVESMMNKGVIANESSLGGITTIIIWLALFVFAFRAPKFFREALGIKGDGFSLTGGLSAIMSGAAAGLGIIGGVRTGLNAASEENKAFTAEAAANGKTRHPLRNFGRSAASAIGGGIMSGYAGLKAMTGKDASPSSVMGAQAKMNAMRASHSTLPGRIGDSVYGLATGSSLSAGDQATMEANKAASKSLASFKSTAVAEALKKGSYGTVQSKNDKDGKLQGIKFNKTKLDRQMGLADSSGNFNYVDEDGVSRNLNVNWFNEGALGDIEDSQTARYLADDWEKGGGTKFDNGKIEDAWRNASRDLSAAGLGRYTDSYLGQNTYDEVTGNLVGKDSYGNIGKTIGDANANATDMSTKMKNVMHRANNQNKK